MMSKVAPSQETVKLSTLKKPTKVATVRQQPTCGRQTRRATVEAPSSARFSAMTLPSGFPQPQVGQLRYPLYRMPNPQMSLQNSGPSSPCCPPNAYPRFPIRRLNYQPGQQTHYQQKYPQVANALPYPSTAVSSNTLSCIVTPMIQRHARYMMKQSTPSDESPKGPSSSASSRDSGIMSQHSSTSSNSCTNEEFNSPGGGGFRTPQCVPRRLKQGLKKPSVEAPTVKFRMNGSAISSDHSGGTPNSSRAGKSSSSISRLSSNTTSATSSPATPRESWNSSSSTSGEHEPVNSRVRVGRSTSMCSGTLERERRPRKQRSDTFGSTTDVNESGKIPRPTNLSGGVERSSKGEREVALMAKKLQSSFGGEEKPSRNTSIPVTSDRQLAANSSNSQIPTPRAKTLSPPPQFASNRRPANYSLTNQMTPDSSSNSTCTLAANPQGSSASLLNRGSTGVCSNLDDTPTPSNRGTPEPFSDGKPSAVPELVVEDAEGLAVPAVPKSPRTTPKLAANREDQTQGSLVHGPLSHIKLPYSTPVMQRLQHSGTGINGGILKREKSSIYSATGNQQVSEAFGSHMSLSSSGSVMSPATDSTFEAAKLKRELELAHQKVAALTCQLSANTSVVQAFEQSLQSMNQRLHQLSASSALKEREVQELRKIIDRFRCQALQSEWSSSMGNARNTKKLSQSQEFVKSHHTLESEMMLQQAGSMTSLIHSSHKMNGGNGEMSGRLLHDSTARSFVSPTYMPIRDSFDRGSKKGSWFRSSINRAFRRSKSRDPPDRAKVTSTSSHDPNLHSSSSGSSVHQSPTSSIGESPSTSGKPDSEDGGEGLAVVDGNGGAMVVEMLQETVRQLQHQVCCLRAENAYLQRAVDHQRCSLVPSDSDKASIASASATGAFSMCGNPLRTSKLLKELYIVTPEIGQHAVPVFLELGYRRTSSRNGEETPGARRTPAPSSPSQHYLPLPGHQVACPPPNTSSRMYSEDSENEDLSHLHLLGRICLDRSSADIQEKVKNTLMSYLKYLDSDDQIGLTAEAIASINVRITPQMANSGQPTKEIQLSSDSKENCPLRIETGYDISRVTIVLHENAYALEKPVVSSLLNPLAVSSIAWISLLSAPLLCKMIESLLANKCVIIYGPRGSGKLEFGKILIESMAKMFPGFWSSQPTAMHYYLRASSGNAVNEMRQVLLNALLSVEGLVILRLPPSLLPELVSAMTELGFSTHPRKILLLAITDTLIFPEEATKLRNCPGIFPFLADLQSAATYMRRCLRQRFSQFAFQCLDAPSIANTVELEALTEVIEWLPEFWLRCVSSTAAWSMTMSDEHSSSQSSSYPISPFRLLACPLTLAASSMWFREVCDSEGVFRRGGGDSNRGLMRWMASTWPWSSEKLPFVFVPFDRAETSLTSSAASSITSSMIMYDSSASLPALLSTGGAASVSGTGRCVRRTSPCPMVRH